MNPEIRDAWDASPYQVLRDRNVGRCAGVTSHASLIRLTCPVTCTDYTESTRRHTATACTPNQSARERHELAWPEAAPGGMDGQPHMTTITIDATDDDARCPSCAARAGSCDVRTWLSGRPCCGTCTGPHDHRDHVDHGTSTRRVLVHGEHDHDDHDKRGPAA